MCTVLRLKSASKEKSQVLQTVHNPPAASCDRPSAIKILSVSIWNGFSHLKELKQQGVQLNSQDGSRQCLFCFSYIEWRNRKNLMIDLSVCIQCLSSVQLLATPWAVTHQAPLSVGFPRQEYWSRFPFPSPEDLPDPRIELTSSMSPAWQADSLLLSHQGSPPSVGMAIK